MKLSTRSCLRWGGGSDSMLLVGSTPYAQRGVLFDGWRDNHGQDDAPALCWRAPTIVMNPSFDRELIAREIAKDPAKNSAEYLAEFRADIAGFIGRDELDRCGLPGVYERAPTGGVRYHAFVDPSGGGPDEHAIAVAHKDARDMIILDAVRVRKGSPEAATAEFAELLKAYGLFEVTGDNYAKAWPQEAFARHGVAYRRSEEARSDIYLAVWPLINSGRLELLDLPKMLLNLSAWSGRQSSAWRA